MLFGIIGWIVTGLVIGFIASKLVNLKGDDPRLGVAVGAVGAVVGGWMYSLFSGAQVTAFNTLSLFFAMIAAATALLIWHLIRGRAAPIAYLNKRYR
jgi:uncharacterized membrane protein YeaQ/YmgE (transglycosylase-associated protein family)